MSSTSATPDSNPSPSPASKRPVFQTETTGNYWQDVKIAVQRISPREDLENLGQMPCARNSLLSGIASGVGVGAIRAISASPFVASNWAIGTFMLISLGSWTVCQKNIDAERRRMQTIVEAMPKRFVKRSDDSSEAGSSTPAPS